MKIWIRGLLVAAIIIFFAVIPSIAVRAYRGWRFDTMELPTATPIARLALEATSTIPRYQPVSIAVEKTLNILAKIAECESNNYAGAANPNSSAKGLLQILDGTWEAFGCTGNVFNSKDNMSCGLKIATKSGLHHWNESRACWGKRVAVIQ